MILLYQNIDVINIGDYMEERITVCVGTERFETKRLTLMKSSLLRKVMEEAPSMNFINVFNASPKIFEHILEYLRNDKYPFPSEYSYIMKEFGIEYRRKVLCFLCDNEAFTPDNKYCSEHKCQALYCDHAKLKGNYCDEHICHHEGCTKLANLCENCDCCLPCYGAYCDIHK